MPAIFSKFKKGSVKLRLDSSVERYFSEKNLTSKELYNDHKSYFLLPIFLQPDGINL